MTDKEERNAVIIDAFRMLADEMKKKKRVAVTINEVLRVAEILENKK